MAEVRIRVANGYEPQKVEVEAGVTTKLIFNRSNPSACLERVQSKELGFDKELPLNEDVTIEITPAMPGNYGFACGMDMFHGKVVAK